MDLTDTRAVRALALQAAVDSLRLVAVGGGTSPGYVASPPSTNEIVTRAKDFANYINRG